MDLLVEKVTENEKYALKCQKQNQYLNSVPKLERLEPKLRKTILKNKSVFESTWNNSFKKLVHGKKVSSKKAGKARIKRKTNSVKKYKLKQIEPAEDFLSTSAGDDNFYTPQASSTY